jgi:uncharacterized membrane protein YqaE (UPF0057 family)
LVGGLNPLSATKLAHYLKIKLTLKEVYMKILKIILAIVFPPVAAFMQVGATTHLWINIVLTLLMFFPGIIHALWLVLTDKKAK